MLSLGTWLRSGIIAGISGVAGITIGASRLFGRRERQMLQIFFFVISGTLIIAACWWWITSVAENYFAGERPPARGAVEIHGGPGGDSTALKREFPSLVLSELNSLQAKANSAIAAIRQARASIGSATARPADTRFQDVEAPSLLTSPFDVELKIADVDVGSLLSWLSKRSSESNQLKLNIVFNKDGSQSTIYGTVVGRPSYSFSVQADGTVEDIVREVATVIIQKEAVKSDERLVALDAVSFTTLIESLNELALAEKEAFFLNEDRVAKNKELFDRLQKARGFSQFPELQWLTARTAENAELWPEAIQYYRNLLAYYDSPTATLTDDERVVRVREITDKVAALDDRQKASTARPIVVAAGDASQPPGIAKLLAQQICGDYSRIWAQLGISGALPSSTVTMGLVGAPSSSVAEAFGGTIVGSPARVAPSEETRTFPIDDYIASVGQAVRAVAKEVTFVFAGLNDAMMADSQIIESLQAILKADMIDVVLMTYGQRGGTPLNPTYRTVVEGAADKTIVVFAAGNDPSVASAYAALADISLVSQGLDQEGKAAPFTSVAEGGVWTPGIAIPFCSLSSGEPTTGSGTSFSAALVAALAAALATEFPDAKPQQIVSAMKAASGGPPSAPIPLTYPAAKSRLEAILAPKT